MTKIQYVFVISSFICIFVSCLGHEDAYQPDSPHVNVWFSTAENVNKSHVDTDAAPNTGEINGQAGLADHQSTPMRSELFLPKKLPVIVWWSGSLNVYDKPREIKCGGVSCYSTRNRTWLSSEQTKSVFFYGTELDPEDLPLPKMPHHEWALLHEESPMNNYMLVHGPMINLFSHTSTFRRESDFPLTTQHIPSTSYLLDRKPISLQTKNRLRTTEELAPILYVQSHCDVASDRDRYVKELMKYIKVDSYGACLNNKQLPPDLRDPVESMGSEKFLTFIARYKFHLAFENALCDDYITEKLFRSVHVGSVPIYRGSPTAGDWMPNEHSIIMANDFDSPEQLASFIKEIDVDDLRYDKYLTYKQKGLENSLLEKELKDRPWLQGRTDVNFISAFECHVCRKISAGYSGIEKDKSDAGEADKRSHLRCPQPYPAVGDITELTSKDRY